MHYNRWRRHGEPGDAARHTNNGLSVADRFWLKVDQESEAPCWRWIGYLKVGYGRLLVGRRTVLAHRFAYELLVGPIPDGLTLDHLCRNPSCVNPAHLEPVTQGENNRRVSALRTHCAQGHEFTPENTYRNPAYPLQRVCRACSRERQRARQQRRARIKDIQ